MDVEVEVAGHQQSLGAGDGAGAGAGAGGVAPRCSLSSQALVLHSPQRAGTRDTS